MNKSVLVAVLGIILFIAVDSFATTSDFDDIGKSFKDMERSLKGTAPKQVEDQLIAPPAVSVPAVDTPVVNSPIVSSPSIDMAPKQVFPQRNIQGFDNAFIPKKITSDRGASENEEKLKKMLDAQNKSLNQNLEEWGLRIPRKFQLTVDISAVVLFAALFSFILYKRKVRQQYKRREEDEEEDKKRARRRMAEDYMDTRRENLNG